MNLSIKPAKILKNAAVCLSGSKSETNRLLLLQALFGELRLENTSDSDDSIVMQKALAQKNGTIDVHHAGTAMRFLTAYFACTEETSVVLTGSARMKQRPVKILVDALRQLGAAIDYLENDGFPPIRISGKKLTQNQVSLKADVSSQYISALLLIAPKLRNGLKLSLEGEITSLPYINMTLSLLQQIGIRTAFIGNEITVYPAKNPKIQNPVVIESDWSSASYFYAIVALSDPGAQITLSAFKKESLQGDSALVELYKSFGVKTHFEDNRMTLVKENHISADVAFQLNTTPDIAQTIAVTCFGLGMGCHLTGLHTLKIKETDRLEALKTELSKLGAKISVTVESLTLESCGTIRPDVSIATYNDHRMAMAFAPLGLKIPIQIQNAEVVSKSYPAFWKDLEGLGFDLQQIP